MTELEFEIEKVVAICEFIRYANTQELIEFAIDFVQHNQKSTAFPYIMEKLNERLDWNY